MSEVEQRDYRPAANWERLRLRAALLARLREFFSARGFLEVETPLLSADIVVDRHLEPLAVSLPEQSALSPAMPPQLWLQTSPEAAMKRLMAAGAEAIYQITRSFRGGEQGRLHNLEFTIVEWYRRGDGLAAGMTLLDELCQHLLQAKPARRTTYGDAVLARLASPGATFRSAGLRPCRPR